MRLVTWLRTKQNEPGQSSSLDSGQYTVPTTNQGAVWLKLSTTEKTTEKNSSLNHFAFFVGKVHRFRLMLAGYVNY